MEVTALASRELAWRFLCAGLVALSVVRCISWLGSRRRSLSLPKTEVPNPAIFKFFWGRGALIKKRTTHASLLQLMSA